MAIAVRGAQKITDSDKKAFIAESNEEMERLKVLYLSFIPPIPTLGTAKRGRSAFVHICQ